MQARARSDQSSLITRMSLSQASLGCHSPCFLWLRSDQMSGCHAARDTVPCYLLSRVTLCHTASHFGHLSSVSWEYWGQWIMRWFTKETLSQYQEFMWLRDVMLVTLVSVSSSLSGPWSPGSMIIPSKLGANLSTNKAGDTAIKIQKENWIIVEEDNIIFTQ